MSKRTEAAYKAVFEYIHLNILSFECRFVMTDYEVAMRKGLCAVVPSIEQHGCQFHYAQALHRRAQKLPGMLQVVYSKDEPLATKIYRQLIYLPLLPAKDIPQVFNAITLVAASAYPGGKLNDFLRYVKKQWLTRVSNFGQFKIIYQKAI